LFNVSLEIYINKIIRPPIKIKNKMYENHLEDKNNHRIIHIIKVWITIEIIRVIGLFKIENNILINNKQINITSITKNSLVNKIIALEVVDVKYFFDVFI
jgi:hypothetical protein